MNVDYHVKYLKSLIEGFKKRKGDQKDPPKVTPGNWRTSFDSGDFYLVGVPTDGSFHITWKHKDTGEIDKLQSMTNFSYIAALNPVIMMEIIKEYERLKEQEKKTL